MFLFFPSVQFAVMMACQYKEGERLPVAEDCCTTPWPSLFHLPLSSPHIKDILFQYCEVNHD